MGKSKKTTESTRTNTPFAQPDITFALGQNRDLFNQLQNRTAPEFPLVAGFDPAQEQAFDLISHRALAGSPVLDAAQGAAGNIAGEGFLGGAGNFVSDLASGNVTNSAAQFLEPTARGDFLDFAGNPVFQQGLSDLNESVGSIFERAGRTGSGANQSAVARGAGDLAAGIFNQERANQLNAANALAGINNADVSNAINAGGLLGNQANTQLSAASLAPGLAAQDFAQLEALANVGGARQAQEQREIDEQAFRHNFPFENAIQAQQLLNLGIGGLGPIAGGTETGKTTETTSPGLMNSILGGALTAASLFAPGAGGGAGLSGLFGGGTAASGGTGFFNPAFANPSTVPGLSTPSLFGG